MSFSWLAFLIRGKVHTIFTFRNAEPDLAELDESLTARSSDEIQRCELNRVLTDVSQ